MLIVLLYGEQWMPLFLFVPTVGWSRYVLDHHSVAQAAAGAVIGASVPWSCSDSCISQPERHWNASREGRVFFHAVLWESALQTLAAVLGQKILRDSAVSHAEWARGCTRHPRLRSRWTA